MRQWSPPSRRDSRAVITGTPLPVNLSHSRFHQLALCKRVRETETEPQSLHLLSFFLFLSLHFSHDPVCHFLQSRTLLLGHTRSQSTEREVALATAVLDSCIVSLMLSKADHSIQSTPPAGQWHDPFATYLPYRFCLRNDVTHSNLYFPGTHHYYLISYSILFYFLLLLLLRLCHVNGNAFSIDMR